MKTKTPTDYYANISPRALTLRRPLKLKFGGLKTDSIADPEKHWSFGRQTISFNTINHKHYTCTSDLKPHHAWRMRGDRRQTRDNRQLLQQIRAIYTRFKKRYGSPRIHDALQNQGMRVGRHRVARLMQQAVHTHPRRMVVSGRGVGSVCPTNRRLGDDPV
jgi:hypothetical protein